MTLFFTSSPVLPNPPPSVRYLSIVVTLEVMRLYPARVVIFSTFHFIFMQTAAAPTPWNVTAEDFARAWYQSSRFSKS